MAVKRLSQFKETQGFPITALREITLLRRLSHPNVIRLIEVLPTGRSTNLVFEYLEHDFLGLRQRKVRFGVAQIRCILWQVL